MLKELYCLACAIVFLTDNNQVISYMWSFEAFISNLSKVIKGPYRMKIKLIFAEK